MNTNHVPQHLRTGMDHKTRQFYLTLHQELLKYHQVKQHGMLKKPYVTDVPSEIPFDYSAFVKVLRKDPVLSMMAENGSFDYDPYERQFMYVPNRFMQTYEELPLGTPLQTYVPE